MSVLKILKWTFSVVFLIMVWLMVTAFVFPRVAEAREACGSPPNINYTHFPYAFLCPRDSSNPKDAVLDPININGMDGSSYDEYRQIPAGRVLSFRTGFNAGPNTPRQSPNDTTPNSVYVWTTIDINDSTFGGAWESVGARVVPPGASVSEASADGSLQCPTINAYAGTGPGDINRSPYADSPGDVAVTCLSQGRYIYWRLEGVPAERNARFTFNVKINDSIPAGSEQKICIRTNISVRYVGDTMVEALSRIAKKSVRECYRVTSTETDVFVRSAGSDEEDISITSNAGTGKVLSGVPITESKVCDGNPANQTVHYTNSVGETSFQESVGGRYCLRAPTIWQAPGDPTIYQLRTPILNNTVDLDSWENQVAGVYCMDRFEDVGFGPTIGFETDCEGRQPYDEPGDSFEFVYDPISIPPDPYKSAFPGGSSLLPGNNPICLQSRDNFGCRVDYSVSIQNNRDGTFFNTEIDDNIPLNLKQGVGDVVIDRIVLSTNNSPFKPPDWSTGGFDKDGSTCRTGVQEEFPFAFGYGGVSEYSEYSCAFYPAYGASPAHVRVHFDEMPAYSTLTLYWHGYTKEAQNIGVYLPGTYCAGAVNVEIDGGYSNPGVVRNCEDRNLGLQGVSNYATTSVDGDLAPTASNVTYNPLPGDILDVKKTVTTEQGIDADEDGTFEYDPLDPDYDNGSYSIQVTPNPELSPVEYQVIDQDNGLNDFNANPLDPVIQPPDDCQPSATATIDCSSSVKWNFLSWPFNVTPGYFNFDVTFKGNAPIGSKVSNTAKVCWRRMWEPGHWTPSGVSCKPSNTVEVERGKTNQPYFGALRGGIQAGGGIAPTRNAICLTANHGDIRANDGSYGQYIVSAKGELTASSIGLSQTKSQKCRPNIHKSVDDYAKRGSLYRELLPSSLTTVNTNTPVSGVVINQAAYPAGGPSKVLRSAGDITITDLTVSRRWTLHVQGDLYIKGDIKRDPMAGPVSNQPSLGILVDGDVYISKDVANIDAFIYSGKPSLTGVGGGTINTCSFGPNLTLGSPGGYSVEQCQEKNLKVNGILMGEKIQFARTRKNTGLNAEAELIELIGQTFLVPPPGFSSLSNSGSDSIVDKYPRF